jgi:hypothetical protein
MQMTRTFRSVLVAIAVAAAAWSGAATTVLAHEDGPEERVMAKMPRAEGRIGNQEIVVTYAAPTLLAPPTLTAFLQRYTDGEPTRGATVELSVDFVPGTLTEVSPGVYESHDFSLPAGRSDIDAAVTIGTSTLTATIPLNVYTTSGPLTVTAPIQAAVVTVPGYVFAAAAGLIYLLVSLLFVLRRRAHAKERAAAKAPDPIGAAVAREGALIRA